MSDYEHGKTYVYDAETQTFFETLSNDMVKDIEDFHRKFELDYNGPPRLLDDELAKFRVGFMAEELGEYSCGGDDHSVSVFVGIVQEDYCPPVHLVDQFDALIDLIYVALGTAHLQGFDMREGWRRVHEANMKKVRATSAVDSKRGSTYDVVKPPGWGAPVLTDLV